MINFILEDNNDKRNQVISKLHGTTITTDSVIRARDLIEKFSEKLILYLDGELPDGTGEQFLKWIIEHHYGQIQEVVIISFGMTSKLIMKRMCDTNGVPCSSYV